MILHKTVLNIDEACELLGYKKSYLFKLTHAKIIPFSKPNGKRLFFSREALEIWMLSNASKSLAERQIEAATYVNTSKGGQAK